MALLSALTLENFRSFRRRTTIELAPLTLLTGPNSSGKSSVLKALLFLQQNAQSDRLVIPTFAGGEHQLGSLSNVRSRDSGGDRIGFGVAFDWGENDEYEYEREDGVRDMFDGPIGHVRFQLDYAPNRHSLLDAIGLSNEPSTEARLWGYGLAIGEPGEERPLFALRIKQWEEDVELDEASTIIGVTEDGQEVSSNAARMTNRCYELELHGGWFFASPQEASEALGLPSTRDAENTAHFLSSTLNIRVDEGRIMDEPPQSLEKLIDIVTDPQSWSEVRCMGESVATAALNNRFFTRAMRLFVRPYLMRWSGYLVDKLGEVGHIGALRASPRRLFLDDAADSITGLLHRASFSYSSYGDKERERSVSEVKRLLKDFGIGDGLRVERVGDAAYTVQVERSGTYVHLADLGYGYTQLVPLILHAAYDHVTRTHPFPTLLVEEPEANLHPNLQAKLADLFAHMSRPERAHAVVETHSEYLIRRLQYLVAAGEVDRRKVVIYYLGSDPEAEDYVRRITIEESGQLSQEFGAGFTDEATNLMVDLYKYGSQN